MLRLRLIINALQLLLAEVWSVAINENIMAYDQEFSFVVSIQYMSSNSSENSHCTGMVLSEWWVSTSCLCLRKLSRKEPSNIAPPHKFRIIAGTCINFPEQGKLRFPLMIREHDRCNVIEKAFDFAVMSITYRYNPQDFRDGILARLPVSSPDPEIISLGLNEIIFRGKICTVVGWVGNASIPGSHNLLKIDMEMVPDSVCTTILCTMAPSVCRSPSTTAGLLGLICGRAYFATPCEGFQGAPLVCGSNVWATASLVNRCGNELVTNNFAVFTRIDVGYDFLLSYSNQANWLLAMPPRHCILILWALYFN